MDEEPESQDDVLAAALASGLSVPKAAAKANMGERTARRRLADVEFRRRVDELRSEAVAQAVAHLGRSMSTAAAELRRLLKSKDERVRLAAADKIIQSRLRAGELADLERQVADLHRRMETLSATGK